MTPSPGTTLVPPSSVTLDAMVDISPADARRLLQGSKGMKRRCQPHTDEMVRHLLNWARGPHGPSAIKAATVLIMYAHGRPEQQNDSGDDLMGMPLADRIRALQARRGGVEEPLESVPEPAPSAEDLVRDVELNELRERNRVLERHLDIIGAKPVTEVTATVIAPEEFPDKRLPRAKAPMPEGWTLPSEEGKVPSLKKMETNDLL